MENDVFVTIAFICAHTLRQTVCVGFVLFYRARRRAFLSRETGRILACRLSSLIASVISFTSKEKLRVFVFVFLEYFFLCYSIVFAVTGNLILIRSMLPVQIFLQNLLKNIRFQGTIRQKIAVAFISSTAIILFRIISTSMNKKKIGQDISAQPWYPDQIFDHYKDITGFRSSIFFCFCSKDE